jgi:hypothetical protein
MMHEETQARLVENERQQAEVGALRQANATLQERVAALTKQLQTALARIAELEQRTSGPLPFVKPNRLPPSEPKKSRKKRASEHNTSRKRAQPTRIERHALAHCPDCGYRLGGESIAYTREVI